MITRQAALQLEAKANDNWIRAQDDYNLEQLTLRALERAKAAFARTEASISAEDAERNVTVSNDAMCEFMAFRILLAVLDAEKLRREQET